MVDGIAESNYVNPLEAVKVSQELGVVINEKGRICETGWPEIIKEHWPKAYDKIGEKVAKQIKYELFVRESGKKNNQGYEVIPGASFVLSRIDLSEHLKDEVLSRVDGNEDEQLKICDIGGGTGEMLSEAIKLIKQDSPDIDLHTTLTTLVQHDKKALVNNLSIDSIRTMAVELPHDDMSEAFDIITCQNSVYNWTEFPELSTLNMWKMLKDNGVVIGTTWKRTRKIDGKEFDTLAYLKNTPLFDFEEIGEANEGAAVAFKLTKKQPQN